MVRICESDAAHAHCWRSTRIIKQPSRHSSHAVIVLGVNHDDIIRVPLDCANVEQICAARNVLANLGPNLSVNLSVIVGEIHGIMGERGEVARLLPNDIACDQASRLVLISKGHIGDNSRWPVQGVVIQQRSDTRAKTNNVRRVHQHIVTVSSNRFIRHEPLVRTNINSPYECAGMASSTLCQVYLGLLVGGSVARFCPADNTS